MLSPSASLFLLRDEDLLRLIAPLLPCGRLTKSKGHTIPTVLQKIPGVKCPPPPGQDAMRLRTYVGKGGNDMYVRDKAGRPGIHVSVLAQIAVVIPVAV